jgi:hypothetical protein
MPLYPRRGKTGRPGSTRRPFVSSAPSVAPEAPTISRVAVTREFPPDKMAVRINAPNGYKNRWAEDEPDPSNILSNIEISDEMPGGDSTISGLLARDPQLNLSDEEAFADMYAYLPGVEKVWEGFLDKTPEVSGEQMSISPNGLGYQSILEDERAGAVGFIHKDLSAWEGMSLARRRQLLELKYHVSDVEVTNNPDPNSVAALRLSIQDVWQNPGAVSEGWLDAGSGIKIAKILWDRVSSSNNGATEPIEAFNFGVGIYGNDTGSTGTGSPDSHTANHDTDPFTEFVAPTPMRYGLVQWVYGAAGGIAGGIWDSFLTHLAIIANHGLELQGTWPNVGFKAKQMLEYLIPRLASPLKVDPGYMDDDEFIIQHAWYGERGPTSEIVHDVTKYGFYDWFCGRGKGKLFQYRKPGAYGRFWKSTLRESDLNEVGVDSQRLWRSIVVQFQDTDGSIRYVGPPGSGCEVESPLLEIHDPDHPAIRAERTRNDILDLRGIGSPAVAIEVGKRFLEEANLLNHAGSATLTGYVMDMHGVFWPAACVRSGDYISVTDSSDTSYRKIVGRKYGHDNRGAEIEIDAPPSGMEALLERLQSVLIPLGVS